MSKLLDLRLGQIQNSACDAKGRVEDGNFWAGSGLSAIKPQSMEFFLIQVATHCIEP